MAKRIVPSNDDLMSEILGRAQAEGQSAQEARKESETTKATPTGGAKRAGAPISPDVDELAENLKAPDSGSKTINIKVSKQAHAAFKAASAIEGLQYCDLLEKLLQDAYPYLFTR